MPSTKRLAEYRNDYSTAYNAMKQTWIDALNLKEPLPDTLARYLNQYSKEDKDEHRDRVKRLAQVNFVDLIIDTYAAMLYSTNIRIVAKKHDDVVQRFVKRCNPQGDTLIEYFREMVEPMTLLYGAVDVFCDKPTVAEDEIVETVQQQIDAGLDRPYCYVVPPINRVAWELDDAGNYVFYQSSDIIDTQVQSQLNIRDKEQFRIWTPDEISTYTRQDGQEDTKANPYGLIPAVTVTNRYALRYHKDKMGLSLVKDVIDLQKLVLNLISLIFDFHENVNFGMRVIIQDTSSGDEPPTEDEVKEGGNKRGIILKGKDSQYQLVTPESSGVESMRCFLGNIIDMAYRSVYLTSDNNYNKTHTTDKSIRAGNTALYSRLTRIAGHRARDMQRVIEMALIVQGIDPVEAEVSVAWDTSFAMDAAANAAELFEIAKRVFGDMSPLAVTELAKKTVNPWLYDSGKIDEINKQMEKWTGPAVQEPDPADTKSQTVQNDNTELNAAIKVDDDEGE